MTTHRCDLCGTAVPTQHELHTLLETYRAHGVTDVCDRCHREIAAAKLKAQDVAMAIVRPIVHRAIDALKRRFA